MRKHGFNTTLVFLPADGEASWALLPSSVSLLSDDTVEAKHLFLYPQGEKSGQRKPKMDKYQH